MTALATVDSGWPFGALERGKYGVVLADPPWRFATWSDKGRGRSPDGRKWGLGQNNNPARHYETMTLDAIKALPVGELAAPDCVLLLWAVDSMLPHALEVGAAWGFKYKTVGFYWAKFRRGASTRGRIFDDDEKRLFPIGTGYWTRSNPEQCFLFTRGSPKRIARNVRKLMIAPRREHSRKPDETHERIEALCAGPYVELFARQRRAGWDAWGAQLPPAAPPPPPDFDPHAPIEDLGAHFTHVHSLKIPSP